MDLARALETAVLAAREGGELLRRDRLRPDGPRGHGDKADADVEAEHLIRRRLLEATPGWGYLGEETGTQAGAPGLPVWLVDPNDGTRDYLLGRRGSSVSIGAAVDGRPVLGVVFAFAYPDEAGDLFTWAEGCGPVRRNGRVVEHTLPETLETAHVVVLSGGADSAAELNTACVAPARFRALTSIAHRLALVAGGDAEATVSLFGPKAWDYGGGHALLRGIGGTLLDESGREITYAADGSSQSRRAFGGSEAVARELSRRPWDGVFKGHRGPRPLVRLERGRAIDDPPRLARAQGCLLGQVAGDNLGALVEFESAGAIAHKWPDGPRRLQDRLGTWNLLAGQPTDDSEMALALARSIVRVGRFDAADVRAAYVDWLGSGPFDVGGTTRTGLRGHPDPASQANGALMRVSPLAVHGHRASPETLAAWARADAAITHVHPACGDASAAFAIAIAHAIDRGDGPRAAYEAAVSWAEGAGADALVRGALADAAREAPVCDGASQGWVRIALQNAFHELLHAATLEEGVVRTVRRGGDTDTNAAIAGALLGAVHGRDAVPAQWRRMVTSCRPLAGVGVAHPRPMTYWPVDALELAERLLLAGEPGQPTS